VTTSFLQSFSRHLIEALLRTDNIELVGHNIQQATDDLTLHLAKSQHSSLVSEVGQGLVNSAAVAELFATDEDIKDLIDDLDPQSARG
jgi:hypothetical protein